MNKNSTKKSLKASALSIMLCLAMLIGTTFAWFTDSITNSGNKIQAGSLDIGAVSYDVDAAGDKTVTIPGVNGDKPFNFEAVGADLETSKDPIINDTLWEPGKTNAKLLQVTNKGTLAAKIKLSFDVKNKELEEYLWFDFVQLKGNTPIGDFKKRPMNQLSELAKGVEVKLEKDQNVRFVLVYGMDESIGNIAQNKTFSADVAILATQLNSEEDGFGNPNYDKDATLPWDGFTKEEVVPDENGVYDIASPASLAWLVDEINNGTENFKNKTVELSKDINLNNEKWEPIVFTAEDAGITINGNGHTIKNMNVSNTTEYGGGFIKDARGAITIKNLKFDNASVAPINPEASKDKNPETANVVGIVMGYTYGTTVFENVEVTNSKVAGYGKIGVMVGMGADPGVKITFKNCVSKNNKIVAAYNAGGLAGNIQRKNGVDNTVIKNCTVEGNIFKMYDNEEKYVDLNNQTVAFTENDLREGTPAPKAISGKHWKEMGAYWGAYAKYYVSYGSSSYDPKITTEGVHKGIQIANSEICVDSL